MKKILLALIINFIFVSYGLAGMREISCEAHKVKDQLLKIPIAKRKLNYGDIFLMSDPVLETRKLIASLHKKNVGNVKTKRFLIYVSSGDDATQEEVLTVKTIYDNKVKSRLSSATSKKVAHNLDVKLLRPNYRNPHKCDRMKNDWVYSIKRSKVSLDEYVKFHRENGANEKLADFHINFKKGNEKYKCLNTAHEKQKYRLDNRKQEQGIEKTALLFANIWNNIGKNESIALPRKVAANVQHVRFRPVKGEPSCFRLLLTSMSNIEQMTVQKVGSLKKIVWHN